MNSKNTLTPLFWNEVYLGSLRGEKLLFLRSKIDSKIITYEVGKTNFLIDNENVDSYFCGQIIDNIFYSLLSGTFGGFYDLSENYSVNNLLKIISILKNNYNVEEININLPPDHLINFKVKQQVKLFLDLGGVIYKNDIDYVIDLKEWTLNHFSSGNLKKLKKANNYELIFKKALFNDIEKVYKILDKNRKSIGGTLSLSLEDLSSLINNFQEHYSLYLVCHKGKEIASCVTVETSPDNLYVLYWGDLIEFRNLSPITFLAFNLINCSKDSKYKFLDLGVSNSNFLFKPTLAKFKLNLGADIFFKFSLKLSLEKF